MIKQFWLNLKAQRYLLPLLLAVVAFQLLLAQTSSYVLADRQPPLALAVQELGSDEVSQVLIDKLSSANEFEIIDVDPVLSPESVFRQYDVQGLLVIPSDYGALIADGEDSSVIFHVAPGITNDDFATEQIAAVVVQIRARYDLIEALQDLGISDFTEEDIANRDLLSVSYDGPALQAQEKDATPVYAVSALLVLLAYLHSALTVPTREDKRLMARGKTSFYRQLVSALMVVWLVWMVAITLFLSMMYLLTGVWPPLITFLAYVAVMVYVSLLGALVAQFTGRHVASWMFLPLFLLSMTLGGGLWAMVAVSPIVSPLIPIAAVSSIGVAAAWGIGAMAAAVVVVLVALALRLNLTFRKATQL